MMLQRNLVYTGITRARTKVYLVGSVDAYAMAVNNHNTEVRRTHLPTRLRQALGSKAKNRLIGKLLGLPTIYQREHTI